MAATNIFYRIPNQKGTRVASIAGTKCTLDQFCNHIFDTEGLNRRDFIIASGTKVFRPSSCNLQSISLQNNTNVDILITLLGGKGGFGSLLRAIGAQIEKTTNRDACRDLSGRRLRDIKREDELKKLIELRTKLEEERKRRKQEKLEKLKKNNEISKTSASIQELVSIFDDHAFNKRRLELGDIIDAAVEKGLIASKKRQMGEESEDERNKRAKPDHEAPCSGGSEASTSSQSRDEDIHLPSTNEQIDLKKTDKRIANKNHKLAGRSLKKRDLWLGLEEDDLEDSSEDDDQGKNSSSAVVT